MPHRHLGRKAFLYGRQAVPGRDFERDGGTAPPDALRARAVALGWSAGRVVVIDSDIDRSGWSSVDREGFRLLLDEVGKGNAGLRRGCDVSRFSRNASHGGWRRPLWRGSLPHTRLLDEDRIFDLRNAEERLIPGSGESMCSTLEERELRPNSGRGWRDAVDGRGRR